MNNVYEKIKKKVYEKNKEKCNKQKIKNIFLYFLFATL